VRVFVENHGCRLNQADGDGLEALLGDRPCEVVASATAADVVVLNTCTITHRAGADARQRIRALARSGKRVVVTGCHANAAPDELAGLPGVVAVLGNEHKAAVVDVLDTGSASGPALVNADRLLRRRAAPSLPLNVRPARSRAYLKVQDGCNYRCAFCIVPSVRGRSQSVPLDEVSRRAQALARAGVPEVVLTGVHLGTYGWDLGLRPGLVPLVRAVLDAAPMARVRLGSVDPHEVDDELVELFAAQPRLCRQLHLPIQSGDDEVLRRMRRAHRVAHLERVLPRLRERVPGLAVGSDVIVGHPGETSAAFDRSVEIVRRHLDYVHVFTYSERPGTEAASMADSVPVRERHQRNRALREVADHNWRQFVERLEGRRVDVVVHRRRHGATGHVLGTTEHGVRVRIDSEAAGAQPLLGRRLTAVAEQVVEVGGVVGMQVRPLI